MRHQVRKKHLGRDKAHRTSMLTNLINSLLLHDKIKTTETRAKVLRGMIDRIVVTAKKKEEREAIRYLQKSGVQKEASIKLLTDIVKRFEDRNSGFTRITPIEFRSGDNAKIVQIAFLK